MHGVKMVELPIWETTCYTKTCPIIAAGATGNVSVDRLNLVSLPALFIFCVRPNMVKRQQEFIANNATPQLALAQSDWAMASNLEILQLDITINTSGSACALTGRSHVEIDQQMLLDMTR